MERATSFDISDSELEREVRAYREARNLRLGAEKGWLSLVNKVWLGEGAHRIGSADSAEVALPHGKAPPHLATVTREGNTVTLVAAPGVVLAARGGPTTSLVLRPGSLPEPDVVTFGTLSFELLQRGDDVALRVRDTESPLRLGFRGVAAYAVDPSWRLVARLRRYEKEHAVVLEDGDGRPQSYLAPGIAEFERGGAVHRLEPVFESDGRRLFLLFSDETNRDDTYGAGRFLYSSLPIDGRLVLDFNKAFNPPCAFTPYAVCPLPAPENRLRVRVEAGERRPPSP